MIRLLVRNPRRPPSWLRQFRVNSLRSASHVPPAVVWMVDLLARLDQLDPCLGNHPAVELLEVVKGFLIVPTQEILVSDAQSRASDSGTGRGRSGVRSPASLAFVALRLPFAGNEVFPSCSVVVIPGQGRAGHHRPILSLQDGTCYKRVNNDE